MAIEALGGGLPNVFGVPKLKVTREQILALPALKCSPTGLSALSIKYSRRKYLKVLLSFGHSEEAQFWLCSQKKPNFGYEGEEA